MKSLAIVYSETKSRTLIKSTRELFDAIHSFRRCRRLLLTNPQHCRETSSDNYNGRQSTCTAEQRLAYVRLHDNLNSCHPLALFWSIGLSSVSLLPAARTSQTTSCRLNAPPYTMTRMEALQNEPQPDRFSGLRRKQGYSVIYTSYCSIQ